MAWRKTAITPSPQTLRKARCSDHANKVTMAIPKGMPPSAAHWSQS